MTDEETLEIKSRKINRVCNVISAFLILVAGGILLAFGISGETIGFSVAQLALPVILLAIGLVLLFRALVKSNTVTLYLSVIFLVSSAISFIAHLTPVTYGVIYPLYIASPGIASFFTMLMSREYAYHLRLLFLFAVPAVFFQLLATAVWSVDIFIPAIVFFVGVITLDLALSAKSVTEE